MRSIDEQLNEITARSAKLRRKQKLRRMIAAESISSCVCLALLIRCAVVMPFFETAIRDSADVYYGGLLLSSPSLGYVVIGVLGFLLGICITILCVHLHKQRQEGDKRE